MIKLSVPSSVTLPALNKALSAYNLTATGSNGNFNITVTPDFVSGFVHRAISQYNITHNQSSSLHVIGENNFQLTFFKKSAASNLTVYNADSSDDNTDTPKYIVNSQSNTDAKHRSVHIAADTETEEEPKIKRYHLIKGDYIQHKKYMGAKSKNKYFAGTEEQTYKQNNSNEADKKTTVQLASIVAKKIIKNAYIDTKTTNYGWKQEWKKNSSQEEIKVPLIANITQVGTSLGKVKGKLGEVGNALTMGGLGFATFDMERNTDNTIDITKKANHYDARLNIPEKNTVVNTTKKTSLMEFITEYMTLGLMQGTMGGLETVLRKQQFYRKMLSAKLMSFNKLGLVFMSIAKIGFSYFMSTILTNYIKNEIFGAKNTEHLKDKMLSSSSDLKQVSFYQHFAKDVDVNLKGGGTSFNTGDIARGGTSMSSGGSSIFANTGWFYSRSVVQSHVLNAAVHYSENYFGSMYTKAISGVQFSFYVTDTIKLSSLAALVAKNDNWAGYAATRMLVTNYRSVKSDSRLIRAWSHVSF